MQQDNRLPHNNKEGAIYGATICSLTALVMTTFNVLIHAQEVNAQTLQSIAFYFPLMFVIAMLVEPLLVGRIAEKAMHRLSPATDSGNAKILFRMVFTVFGMSLVMTGIGNLIAFGAEGWLGRMLHDWPRNFFVVLILEALIIQPIARAVMVKLHQKAGNAKAA
ncbi:DUF2798 domain-containing protein [Comamonas sp. Y33R10-2]|uniref:DUF2798 domain-containing protein n=1 Tax=Comamonas sp. Y33R10-2 TaxID=2853257 RepID=UPI001C5CC071|nr:DUF2798 domain-containing protein [Comamonas sp. Y33R10-2]QXZ10926.1 DUF2798 domain-containing protein [Comamonas sp. Y33R10-2]